MSNLLQTIFQKIRTTVLEEMLPALVDQVVKGLHGLVDEAATALKSGLNSLGDQVKIALKSEPPVMLEGEEPLPQPSDRQPLVSGLIGDLAAFTDQPKSVSTQLRLDYPTLEIIPTTSSGMQNKAAAAA